MSEDESSISSSTSSLGSSTEISTSTIPGLGATSGKAFKRLGLVVIQGVDAVAICRRLTQIECASVVIGKYGTRKSLYSDLLELSRPVYTLCIRTRAFCQIMKKVAQYQFGDLAIAVGNSPFPDSYNLLKAMLESIQSNFEVVPMEPKLRLLDPLDEYHSSGQKAYMSVCNNQQQPQQPQVTAQVLAPFMHYVGLIISLSQGPELSRLVIECNMIVFITKIYQRSQPNERAPARFLMCALLEKLDPMKDAQYIVQLQDMLSSPAGSPAPPVCASSESMSLRYLQFHMQDLHDNDSMQICKAWTHELNVRYSTAHNGYEKDGDLDSNP